MARASAVRPMVAGRPGADNAPMSLYCQRCGAHARLWTLTVSPSADRVEWYNARLCGICTRSVVAEFETQPSLTEPVYVYLTLEVDR